MRIHEITGRSDIDRLQTLHRMYPDLSSARQFLLESVAEQFTPGSEGYRYILLAAVIGTKTHGGVVRKSGDQYFRHPIMVALAYMLRNEVWDYREIVSRLLHDVVEDGNWTIARLRKRFCNYVVYAVWSVSRPKTVFGLSHDFPRHGAYRLKLLLAFKRVVQLKIHDVEDNLTDLFYMSESHRKKKLREARYFYLPLAALRLGVTSTRHLVEAIGVAQRMHNFKEDVVKLGEQNEG